VQLVLQRASGDRTIIQQSMSGAIVYLVLWMSTMIISAHFSAIAMTGAVYVTINTLLACIQVLSELKGNLQCVLQPT
jgi:hypothetical protein